MALMRRVVPNKLKFQECVAFKQIHTLAAIVYTSQ